MRQIDLDYFVIATLLVCGLYVATTGLVMDLFGVPQFLWHSYLGYASAVLAGLHLALNWSRVTAYLRRRFRWPPSPKSPPQRAGRTQHSRRRFLTSALAAMGGFLLGWLTPRPRLAPVPDEVAVTTRRRDMGLYYHQWSRPGVASALGALLNWGSQPTRYKTYDQATRVTLPEPPDGRGLTLDEAIDRRRSRRRYTDKPLSLAELSRLLHAASGITAPTQGFRAAPSAGALYPIETYVVVHRVTDLEAGVYHYAVADHALEQVRLGDFRTALMTAGLGQEVLSQAPVCFVLTAIFQRTRWKYRERSYRYILLETGHIGQNLYLSATSLGLGACAVGAFLDEQLNRLLGVDGEAEAALYLIAVGKV